MGTAEHGSRSQKTGHHGAHHSVSDGGSPAQKEVFDFALDRESKGARLPDALLRAVNLTVNLCYSPGRLSAEVYFGCSDKFDREKTAGTLLLCPTLVDRPIPRCLANH